MKKLIAYSSVAHMGFVTLGIFTFTSLRVRGGDAPDDQPRHHHRRALPLVGIIYERTHSRQIYDNAGLGKFLPVYVGFFGLFASPPSPSPGPTASWASCTC